MVNSIPKTSNKVFLNVIPFYGDNSNSNKNFPFCKGSQETVSNTLVHLINTVLALGNIS